MYSFKHISALAILSIVCVLMSNNLVQAQGSTTQQSIKIVHPSAPTAGITIAPPASISTHTLTLPGSQGGSGSVLQNDGTGALTWSSVGTVKYARKTANESVTSSVTLQDDNHLTLAVGANEVWEIELFFRVVVTSGTNGGVKMQLMMPSGSTCMIQAQAWIGYDASAGYIGQDFITGSYNFYYTGLKTDANGGNVIRLHGVINTSSTAGDVYWQWAQQASSATATTGAVDSYMKLNRIQ